MDVRRDWLYVSGEMKSVLCIKGRYVSRGGHIYQGKRYVLREEVCIKEACIKGRGMYQWERYILRGGINPHTTPTVSWIGDIPPSYLRRKAFPRI